MRACILPMLLQVAVKEALQPKELLSHRHQIKFPYFSLTFLFNNFIANCRLMGKDKADAGFQ